MKQTWLFAENRNGVSQRRRSLRTLCSEVVLLLTSAFVLSMAFPSFLSKNGLGFLAVIALIPVFAVIKNTTWTAAGFYGFLYGFVYYRIFNYWLSAFHPLANLIVQIIKGTEMVFLFLSLKSASEWVSGKYSHILQSFIWVAYSYLSQSWFAGYPYGTVAYAFANYRLLIQIASICGIWGLNFLIIFPQALVGRWLGDLWRTGTVTEKPFREFIRKNRISLYVYAALVVFQIVFGIVSLAKWSDAKPDRTVKIATVQHNADSWAGGYATYEKNFHNLQRMSLQSLSEKPDMIVWSETAFVPSVNWYTKYPYTGTDSGASFDYLRKIQVLVDEFVDFATGLGIPLLTGNPSGEIHDASLPPYDENGDWNKDDYNSVILFENGGISDIYLKQHLVPFTEHFPYEKQLPHMYRFLKDHDYHWWKEGKESTVFTLSDGLRFSTPVCFEDIFGYLCAGFVRCGADLLVNMTNDSWSGSVAAERQHSAMAVFRAVETRKTVLRGTNSGITCLITPDGKVAGEMEPFTMGWKTWDVPVFTTETYGTTIYTKVSDVTAEICVYIALAGLVAAALSVGINKCKKEKKE
mgnify:CR=1 FL=1